MKGFFAIDFIDFERLVLNDENFSISSYDVLFRFCRSEKYTNDLGITLRVFNKELNDSLFINAKDIFVTTKEIYKFLNGNRINSLNTVKSYIKEWNEPTRHSQEVNSDIETPQKEKEVEVEQRNKGGRPQNPLKSEAIRIAKDTFEHYKGDITRIELAGRISSYLRDKHKEDISEETVKKYLTEQGIGNRKGTSKNFKIIDTI